MSHKIPLISDKKYPTPDYYIAEWVGRSADKYEPYNAKKKDIKRAKKK